MARRPSDSINDQKKINLRSNLIALKNIPRFFREIHHSSPQLFWSNIICRLLSSSTPILLLWVGKLIVDEILDLIDQSNTSYDTLWMYVGIELGLVFINDLINRAISLTDGLMGDKYSNNSSVLLIKKTKEVEISQLEDAEFYDKLERARTQTNSRVNLMSSSLGQIQGMITVTSLAIGLIIFEPLLVVLVVLSIIPAFINEFRFSSKGYSLARSWTQERRELDYLRYIGANDRTAKELKLFGLSDFIADRFWNLANQYYQENKILTIRKSVWGGVFNALGVLSYYAAYVFIIYRVLNGALTVGELTFLSGSFNRLKSGLERIFSSFTRIAESALYLRDYFDFVDIKSHIIPNETLVPIPSEIKQGFTFEKVSFSYPGAEETVLNEVNFTILPGEKIAFVGENGAGKTTLIKLMLRFYKPTSGRILLEGIDITNFDVIAYQQLFGVIFQDFIRYELTIRENIGVGKIDELEDEARILRAAEQSLANSVLDEMTMGLDQQLGKRFKLGKDLSGGQWQKIALARAYMKNADILILDEPTASLDARAEYEAFQRFIALTKDKTSVIISHRFSTVRMADRIMVLKNGRVLEIGTHEELMENRQLYAELFELQAQGYQ